MLLFSMSPKDPPIEEVIFVDLLRNLSSFESDVIVPQILKRVVSKGDYAVFQFLSQQIYILADDIINKIAESRGGKL